MAEADKDGPLFWKTNPYQVAQCLYRERREQARRNYQDTLGADCVSGDRW